MREPAALDALIENGLGQAELVFSDGDAVAAAAVAETGVKLFGPGAPSNAVAAILTNDSSSVSIILGAVRAGARLVSLPIPGRGADLASYLQMIGRICRQESVEEIVVHDRYAKIFASAGLNPVPHHKLARRQGHRPLAGSSDAGFELVQFTSGSTDDPKPVQLSGRTLAVNIEAILERIEPRPGDVVVSWLPLSHDMGLVGMLLASLVSGDLARVGRGTIVLLSPEDFLRRPTAWLQAVEHWRGTITAAPSFGYELATRSVGAASLADLRSLRCAIVGGDVIRADTLQAFDSTFEPAGLSPLALCPSYGMAELGLAASMTPPSLRWQSKELDLAALAERHVDEPRPGEPGLSIASSGPALDGYRVDAPTRSIGTLRIHTPAGGLSGRDAEGARDRGLTTTDEGFVEDGWLYVTGRSDDIVSAHGRNLHAPAIEAALSRIGGVRPGRVALAMLPTGGLVVCAEPDPREPATGLEGQIRKAVIAQSGVRPESVLLVKPGTLAMTSSGKLRRGEIGRRAASLLQRSEP